jgi:hypothetical protein
MVWGSFVGACLLLIHVCFKGLRGLLVIYDPNDPQRHLYGKRNVAPRIVFTFDHRFSDIDDSKTAVESNFLFDLILPRIDYYHARRLVPLSSSSGASHSHFKRNPQ